MIILQLQAKSKILNPFSSFYFAAPSIFFLVACELFMMKGVTSSGYTNFAAGIAMLVLTTMAVVLRFVVRKTSKQLPTTAEWLCVLSLLLFAGYVGVILNCKFTRLPLRAVT
jgi:hypothetical protein